MTLADLTAIDNEVAIVKETRMHYSNALRRCQALSLKPPKGSELLTYQRFRPRTAAQNTTRARGRRGAAAPTLCFSIDLSLFRYVSSLCRFSRSIVGTVR